MHRDNKPKIIYIAGMGHSGSTLLDLLLGSMRRVISCGEIVNLFFQIYRYQTGTTIPNKIKKKINRYMRVNYKNTCCSCRKEFIHCLMWQDIVDSLSEKVGYDIWENPLKYRLYFPPLGNTPPGFYFFGKVQRKLTTLSHEHAFLVFFKVLFSKFSKNIADNNWQLFDVICKQNDCDFIVDSSKDIHRFHYLYQQRPDQICLIILVRNILGVASSYKKLNRDPVITAKRWVSEYRKIDLFTKDKKNLHSTIINYDDLVNDTEREVKRLRDFLGIHFIAEAKPLNTENHHLVGGNKMRYSGKIKIKNDESWKHILTDKEVAEISVLSNQNPFMEYGQQL